MQLNSSLFRGASQQKVAEALVEFVQEVYAPAEGKWSIEAGTKCIETLLLAARMAYPTSADIESLGKKEPKAPDVVVVSRNLAEQIDAVKRELQEKAGE